MHSCLKEDSYKCQKGTQAFNCQCQTNGHNSQPVPLKQGTITLSALTVNSMESLYQLTIFGFYIEDLILIDVITS